MSDFDVDLSVIVDVDAPVNDNDRMAKAIPALSIEENFTTVYPPPFQPPVAGRGRRRLGDAFGLTQFGVNLISIAPGSQSSLRHWHTGEDELIYMLSGQLVLCTNEGEQAVGPGDVVGFPAGREDAHCFVNRSSAPAQFLVVGTRNPDDDAFYPDNDLRWNRGPDGQRVAAHKDGTPY